MTEPQHNSDEICRLLWAMREDELAPEDAERLRSLLLEDPHARERYVYYMFLFGSLEWDGSARAKDCAVVVRGDSGFRIRGSENAVEAAVELPRRHDPEPRIPSPEPLVLPFPLLSTTHYPSPTPFVGGPVFSYMVATLILGVAILGFWAYKITHHQHIAEAPSQSVPSDVRPEMVFVGRITGMVDVKWSDDPRYLPPPGFAHVPLGRKYILDAGLLEITYDSGAKVILQGPCTYEVESTAGGYLALGKLTARVGARGEGRGTGASGNNQKSEIRNQKSPSSLIPHPSSFFAVRTPTAIVTDLGTEFGVEVDEAGSSKTHVFRGRVEMRLADGGRGEPLTIQLGVGESGRVEHGADGRGPTLVRGAADPTAFSLVSPGQLAALAQQRQLKPFRRWQAFSKELRKRDDLAAYYDFQPDEKDRLMLRNRTSTGRRNDGRIDGARWTSGRFPGKYALRFGWPSHRVRIPIPACVESQQLTLIAWVRLDSLPEDRAGLLMSDGWWKMGQVHWQILRDGKMSFSVVVGPRVDVTGVSSRPVVDGDHSGQWNLLAVACDLAAEEVVFYHNGDCVGRRALEAAKSAAFKRGWVTIANWHDPHAPLTERDLSLQGCVGELMVFRAALSEEEIRRIWKGGEPMNGP